ncbi:B3 domain-containing protein REM8-like [Lotus japonicus]|uniref:B3 domain-containing protein REM8-like n=1 Tax=Lotus japonicus TaxID=34305 RepID=UPI002582C19D|nr:B3 domain-containing protein REM8-like [Lotus japonicus]
MEKGGCLMNHCIAIPLNVEGNNLHFTASVAPPITILVLKYLRCSMGSESPEKASNAIVCRCFGMSTLQVPRSFVKRHWQGISTVVSLRLPNGTQWEVYWLKRDGEVYFRNGWKEFAEHLSLDVSQIVLFGYEGNSCLNVIVLGKSALEIDYPNSKDDNNTSLDQEEECEEVHEVIMIIPHNFARQHLHKMEGEMVILFVDNNNERTWDVELKLNTAAQLIFALGWRKFLRANNLKLGDVCAFVLNSISNRVSLKVVIYPLEKYTSTRLFHGAGRNGALV